MEVFKFWDLRSNRRSLSNASLASGESVLDLDPDTVEIPDSGDEGGDLSSIMAVKPKVEDDPYLHPDTYDLLETQVLAEQLKDSVQSTMEALDAAMGMESDDEGIPLEPPLAHDVVGHESGIPVQGDSEEPNKPDVSPQVESKGFKEIGKPSTVQEIEDRIKYLKYHGLVLVYILLFSFPAVHLTFNPIGILWMLAFCINLLFNFFLHVFHWNLRISLLLCPSQRQLLVIQKSSPATDSLETMPFNASQAVRDEQEEEVPIPAPVAPQRLKRSLGDELLAVSGNGFFIEWSKYHVQVYFRTKTSLI